jgi:hypothetical protein
LHDQPVNAHPRLMRTRLEHFEPIDDLG